MGKRAKKPALGSRPLVNPSTGKDAAAKAKKAAASKRKRLDIGSDLLKTKNGPKKGAEKKKKFEILVDGKEVTNEFGYKMKIFVPKGFNGGIDFYFPGGGSGISVPMGRDNIKGKWMKAGEKGSRRALAIVEGRTKPTWRKVKYDHLKKPGALRSLCGTAQSTYDGPPITNVKLSGHSQGGQAIHKLITDPLVTQCDWYDASYWSSGRIIDFARRGGRIQLVFQTGGSPGEVAMIVIRRLKLKKISRRHWQSADKKVNIYSTYKGHSKLVNPWMSKFFGTSTVPVSTISPYLDRYRGDEYDGGMRVEETQKIAKANPAGALHKKHLDKIKKIIAKTAEADVKTLQGSRIEDVRYNPRLLVKKTGEEKAKEEKERIKKETQRRMKAYSSGYDGKWITLDYAKMGSDHKGRSHEMFIGLGDVLIDPDITEILVKRGGSIFKAYRGVVKSGKNKGRQGFVTADGNYVWSHTGDKYRILNKKGKPDKEYMLAFRSESTQREKHEQLWKTEGYSGGGGTALGGIRRSPDLAHSSERPSNAPAIDRALTSTILDENNKLEKAGKHKVKGQCEGLAIVLSSRVKGKIKDETPKWKSLRRVPLFKKSTARYRGRTVSSLKEDDFAKPGESFTTGKIPIGAAIYAAMDNPSVAPYMKGDKRREIAPVVPKTQRHWWVYAGRDSKTGKVIFVDNRGKKKPRNTLALMQASIGGRKVINIHDPYVNLRGRMEVAAGGKLKEKSYAPLVSSRVPYTSGGRRANFYSWAGKKWRATPEAGFVDKGVRLNSRERFVTGRDDFGGVVILRKSAMQAFYDARRLAAAHNPKIKLRIMSSYRSEASQRRLNPSGVGTAKVAAPGKSWHHSGGAIDIVAYVQNASGQWEGSKWHENQKYLKAILPKAGMVNYKKEPWHWEFGTRRWKSKTGRSTALYRRVPSRRRHASRFEDNNPGTMLA